MPKTFIVGDIHGCYDELMALLEKAELNADDMLVSLGDIVDRGNKSKEVYEYFIGRPNSKVIIGNHERKHINGVLNYAQEIVKVQFGTDYPAFLDRLNTFPYSYEIEEAIIVHAAFEDGVPLDEQTDEVLCGSTSGERYLEKKYGPGIDWTELYKGEKPIIYGHRVVGDVPLIKNNTYGIDTGACHGGYLTAIEIPGFIVHQVKAETDHWRLEQKTWQIPVLRAKDWLNMELTAIKKQIEKLSFVENAEVRSFLDELKNWVTELDVLHITLKDKIDEFTTGLVTKHKDEFSLAANKYDIKTFLFKSKNNNLKIDDVKNTLNTPKKMFDVAAQLNVEIPHFTR